MKTLLIIFVAIIFAVPSLSAKPQSYRSKRLSEKTNYKIDREVVNATTVNETVFNEIKPEKALKDEVRVEKTVRADKIGREPILKATGKPKKRNNTHFREWP